MKILIVEDDRTVAQSLQLLLATYNYAVDAVADGEAALQMADAFEYDLLILDVLLPRLDGISVCQQLRSSGFQHPILLLTGQGEVHQKAIALNTGADDYVVKPFDNAELIARIQALLRRSSSTNSPVLTWGDLSVDPSSRKVAYGHHLLSVTPKEYGILELFLRTPQKTFSAKTILDQVWTSLESPGEEAVRVHIKDLRQKLAAIGAPKDFIKTKHRVGYQLNPLYADFLAQSKPPTAPQIAELTTINEELRRTLEELQIAEEELQQQNEELLTARQSLEIERQRYCDLFEFAPDAYVITDIYGTIQEANCAAAQLFGAEQQFLIGKPLAAFVIESDRRAFRLHLAQPNPTQNWEINVKPRKGDAISVLAAVTSIKNLQDEVVGWRWLLRDVRSRREMERQLQAAHDQMERRVTDRTGELLTANDLLRQSEEKYRTLFNSIDQGYFLADVIFNEQDQPIDVFYLEVNPAAIALVGYDFTGRRLRELTPKYEEFWYEIFGRVAQNGGGERLEQYSGADQSWYDFYVFKVGDADSRRIAVIFRDITERKHREANVALLAEVVGIASRLSTPDEIMQLVGEKIGAFLNVPYCHFLLLDAANDQIVLLDRWNADPVPRLPDQVQLSQSMRAAFYPLLHRGETFVRENAQTSDTSGEEASTDIEATSCIMVPLRKDGEWKYLFAVHDRPSRQWRRDEIEIVRELANQIFPRLERAHTEVTLRQNEQLLRLAMEGAKAGSWNWEITTGKLDWATETYHLHGLDPALPLPEYDDWYSALLHPDDRLWVNDYVMQAIAQHQSDIQLEFRILHPQQGVRWLVSLGHLTLNEQNEPIRYSGINLDITDRKQSEQKIREQAALLDVASDAILVRDFDHRILYWNQGAERLYGWQAAETIGQSAHKLLGCDPALIAEIIPILLEQGQWQGEMQKITKAGKAVTVETRWTLVQDENNQPKSILSVDTDVTEKKQLEAQFYHAQRLESLGRLASGIAHDLNNALTPILTIAQLFRMIHPNLDARSQEMLQVLEESAKRGAGMVKQILTFTRKTAEDCTSTEAEPLLQEVIKVIQQTFPKSIEIQANLPGRSLGSVSVDTTQLHQVLMNLCVNARDAMPEGGTLTLGLEKFEVDEIFAQMNLDAQVGSYLVITVADTGSGIPPEVRDRMFDPFFTTKAIGQGTGLGLSTALGIVKSYGGFMQTLSEVGKGSQFKVYLPVSGRPVARAAAVASEMQGNGELVLIVDDDSGVRQTNQAVLEKHGYSTIAAKDGIEAITLYAKYKDEIKGVLMDMMMPNMNGITAIQTLKRINPEVKVIAVSGLSTHREAALTVGARIFLEKPYTTEHLLQRLFSLIKDR